MTITTVEQGNITTTLTYVLQDRGNGWGVRVNRINPATLAITQDSRLSRFFGIGDTRAHAERDARGYINELRATVKE